MKALFFDTEWANSKNKNICQLAFLEVDLDTLEVLNEFNEYVNPNDSYDRYCIATHHITNKQTDLCDTFDVVWNKIKCYFENNVIIGHNICSAQSRAIIQSIRNGGNALIGVDIDYVNFSNDVIGVVVNGTAVVVEKIEEKTM